MGSLFSSPSAPQQITQAAAPAPLPDVKKIQDDILKDNLLRNRARGRAATILTGNSGDTSTTQTASKTLLGQ